jgi:hypothetical protein
MAGATMQKNIDVVNGVEVFTESYSVGFEALGIQANFDSKGISQMLDLVLIQV